MLDEQIVNIPDFSPQDIQLMSSSFDIGIIGKTIRIPDSNAGIKDLTEYNTDFIVRFSYPLAKVLAIVLRRTIVEYERKIGENISVPQDVLELLGISLREDWY